MIHVKMEFNIINILIENVNNETNQIPDFWGCSGSTGFLD